MVQENSGNPKKKRAGTKEEQKRYWDRNNYVENPATV
jgi:hypothetical protein